MGIWGFEEGKRGCGKREEGGARWWAVRRRGAGRWWEKECVWSPEVGFWKVGGRGVSVAGGKEGSACTWMSPEWMSYGCQRGSGRFLLWGTVKSGCAEHGEQVDVQTQLSPGHTAHSPGHSVLAARCKRHLFATGDSGWPCPTQGEIPPDARQSLA